MPTSGVAKSCSEAELLVTFPSFVCEHGVIEDVEYVPLEFHGETLANFKLLEYSHVQLGDSGLAQHVAPGISDRSTAGAEKAEVLKKSSWLLLMW